MSDSLMTILRDSGLLSLPDEADLDLDHVGGCLERLMANLNGHSPAERELIREGAIRALGDAGIGSPARVVDAAFRACEPPAESAGQGKPILLEDPEPWPEPVDVAPLLMEMSETIRRYVAMSKEAADAEALFIVHTYGLHLAEDNPILCVQSPLMKCGKTRNMAILSALVPRPIPASNITAAALFRVIEQYRPTILIDEADTFLRDSEELRGILNAGSTRATAYAVRTTGDDHEPRLFSVWAGRVIALIGKLPPTLQDRSIVISLRRRAPDEKVDRLRASRIVQEMEPLRRRAARWVRDHADALRAADPEIPEMDDRAGDCWRPLLAVADLAGGEWPGRARNAARALSGSGEEAEGSPRVQLLADLREMFEQRKVDRLPSKDVCDILGRMEDRPWPEYRHGHPITPRQVASLLRPFKVHPKTIKLDDGATAKGYWLSMLVDPFARYLPPRSVTPSQPARDGLFEENDISNAPPVVTEGESPKSRTESEELRGYGSEPPYEGGEGYEGQSWEDM